MYLVQYIWELSGRITAVCNLTSKIDAKTGKLVGFDCGQKCENTVRFRLIGRQTTMQVDHTTKEAGRLYGALMRGLLDDDSDTPSIITPSLYLGIYLCAYVQCMYMRVCMRMHVSFSTS
jgi:hypothetical protein